MKSLVGLLVEIVVADDGPVVAIAGLSGYKKQITGANRLRQVKRRIRVGLRTNLLELHDFLLYG